MKLTKSIIISAMLALALNGCANQDKATLKQSTNMDTIQGLRLPTQSEVDSIINSNEIIHNAKLNRIRQHVKNHSVQKVRDCYNFEWMSAHYNETRDINGCRQVLDGMEGMRLEDIATFKLDK